jgi:hypothetical protein
LNVQLAGSLDAVIAQIEEKEGKKPLVVATSARLTEAQSVVSFFDQKTVWKQDRPVLMLFGTGQGLAQPVIDRCDFLLLPVQGFADFNHLSVRSAVAIVLDRWLGVNQKTVEKLAE